MIPILIVTVLFVGVFGLNDKFISESITITVLDTLIVTLFESTTEYINLYVPFIVYN